MPNYENESDCKVNSKTQEKKLYYKHESIRMDSDKEMEGSANESQNFCLKLSQDSAISDTQDTVENYEKEVIVISDSSSDCSSPKCVPEPKLKSNKQFIANKEVRISDSSDSDFSDTENDKLFQAWRVNKKHNYISHNPTKKSVVNMKNVMYTSDETSSNSSEQSRRFIQSSSKTSSSYVSYTPESNVKAVSKTKAKIQSNAGSGNMLSSCAASTGSTKSSKSLYPPSKTSSINGKHRSVITKRITRIDTQNIMKNIKSTRIVYESPRRENNVIIDESIDSDIHPAMSLKDNLIKNNKIIDETPVDFESDVIENSQVNVTNPNRNYSNILSIVSDVKRDSRIMGAELSERKKRQISQWLMANSPDSRSDSSFSIVPASSKGEISSGNSSLERLEMNYETPNNRGKIHRAPTSDKRITNKNSTDQTCNSVSRQITLHEYTQRTENNVLELRTLKVNPTNKTTVSTPVTNAPEKVDVMDCADILDKLYGKSWRDKADALLPKSEPRKQGISIKSRGIQTERKGITKHKFHVADSDDDDSNTSLKDLNLKDKKHSTKTTERKNAKQLDSFINDQGSSGSGSDSLYYTALTNPRISVNGEKQKTALPPITQRAIAICDSDTASGDDKSNSSPVHDIRGRKLSFNNDDSEDSSTSEFDPGDYVPPRPTVTKDPIKTSCQTSKINTRRKITSAEQQRETRHGFLASLSESVPIANAHPDAKKYRNDFKSNKEVLCKYLFKLYNEKVFDKKLPEDLSIEWNIRMRGTAGFCYNKKSLKTLGGVAKSSRIVLATKVLDTPDRLRDTLIHEMCHAAAWLINDVSDGHGPFWTGWANKAMKTLPELPPIRRCHDYKIKTKFTYRCVGCGYSIGRHSKSLDIERKRCGHCYGKFELLLNKTTKAGTVQVQTPKREPTGFALYVKQNYNFVKKEGNMRHAEVMKTLGQQFSAVKIAKKQGNFENDPDIPG